MSNLPGFGHCSAPWLSNTQMMECRYNEMYGQSNTPGADVLMTLFFWAFVFFAFIGLIAIVIRISDRADLPRRSRWGYALGILTMPFVFIPLYLVLTPPPPSK